MSLAPTAMAWLFFGVKLRCFSKLDFMLTRSSIPSNEFEIHFAAEIGFRAQFHESLLELGFRDDSTLGHGVVFNPIQEIGRVSCPLTGLHMTWDTFNQKDFLRQREIFNILLMAEEQMISGYAHCEFIKPEWDLELDFRDFRPDIKWPVKPFEFAFGSGAKKWDIHISADKSQLDPGLESVIFEYGCMYYIDIIKKTGRVNRVFTVQGTNSTSKGRQLFGMLSEYLNAAGGMAGSIKFEKTCYWKEIGNPKIVPPTISDYEY